MKSENLTIKVFCLALVLIIALFCAPSAFAVGEDETAGADPQPGYTEYVEPSTEYVEPETEYTSPVTEPVQTEEPTVTANPDETEPVQTEPVTEDTDQTQSQIQNVEPVQETTEHFEAPTLAKTVSNKHYTTNYTAGIVSWICVALGVLAVAIVLISNKANGKKNSYR